ncbi:MAG: prepilin-type N-terminal cleavage/methylation domain-containing protein [Planctomycetota bacterium]
MKRHRASAFSLTELLAVIALILILVSVILVSGSSVYSYALRTQCQSRMESVWHACRMYANANDGCLPSAWDDAVAKPWYHTLTVQGYLESPAAAECPASDIVSSFGKGIEPAEDPPDAVDAVHKVLYWLRDTQVRLASESYEDGHGSWQHSPGAWENLAEKPITALALAVFIGDGNEMAYWPKNLCEFLNEKNNYEGLRRDVFATCLAALAVESATGNYFPGSKFAQPGAHSYGYNSLLGHSLLRPAANTIVLIDYINSSILPTDYASEKLASRHNDRMNVLFGDGRVEPRYPEQITSEQDRIHYRLLSPESDD